MDIQELYRLFEICGTVETDSRKIQPGSLFFGLKGDQFDGNRYAPDALANGARFAIIDNPSFKTDERIFVVDDSLKALQSLASHHRKQFNIPCLAITGSNGKTTTKELINRVLKKKYKTVCTEGNLNNHIGVPLTLLKTTPEHQIAIIEMGANHKGEITTLCDIASPDFGLITNIGKAHLDGFGGFEGVIKGKTELYRYLKQNHGLAFVNANDQLLIEKASDICSITYGNNHRVNFFGKGFIENDLLALEFKWLNKFYKAKSHLVGIYNYPNAMAAACIGLYFEIEPERIVEAIEEFIPDNNRSQIVKTEHNTVILDAYNANPGSMEAAINNLIAMKAKEKVAIIGDMLELGKESNDEHINIALKLANSNINTVYLVGPRFSALKNIHHLQTFIDREEAARWFDENPPVEALILLKASRGIGLEPLIKYL